MESFWKILSVFILLIALTKTQDIGKGLVASSLESYFYPARLASYKGNMYAISEGNSEENKLPFTSEPVPLIISLYPDIANKSLYFIDAQSRTISRYENFDLDLNATLMTNTTLHTGISRVLSSIAFDWISKNFYWTDGYFNWISMQPAFSEDKLMFKVLIQDDIRRPYAIKVDPIHGYMFWSDMDNPRIERADLTGGFRKTIIPSSLNYPNAIALDIQNEIIYWADSNRNTIERATYEGFDSREILVSLNSYEFGALVFFDNHLCFTQQSRGQLECVDQTGKSVWQDGSYEDFYGIAAFEQERQPSRTDFCPAKGCSDICVNMRNEARCLCREGYTLQDGKTCKADHALTSKGVLFTNGTNICVLDIRAINDLSGKEHVPQCIVANLSSVKYLQADSVKGLIFFWNSTAQLLQQYDLVSKRLSNISSSRTGDVTGLFYDWINYGLYWSENDTQNINMVDLQEATRGLVRVQSNVNNVNTLTGDPHNSVLYWTSGNTESDRIIESCNMDGTMRKTVVSKGLTNPKGLYHSWTHDRLYWIDDRDIKTFNLKETGEVTSLFESIGDADTLLLYQDYILWTTGMSEIRAAPLASSRSQNRINITAHNNITGMCIFDPRVHSRSKGVCANNGGCQQICTPTASGPKCVCEYGFTLQIDQKTCSSTPYTDNFMMLVDYSHSRIFQVPMDKPKVDVTDIRAVNITDLNDPIGVAYDADEKFLYWTELSTNRLKRGKLDGRNTTTVKIFTDHYPDRIVFDRSTGNLFFTATRDYSSNPFSDVTSYIGVLRLRPDPLNPKHLKLIDNLDDPRSLALYPSKGYIFFGEGGWTSFIGRANMDGTDQKELVSNTIMPLGITVDYANDMLYYCDYSDEIIYRIDIEGKGDPEKFYSHKNSKMADAITFGDHVYYIGWNMRNAIKVKKVDQKEVKDWMPLIPYFGRLDNVGLVPEEQQPGSGCYSSTDANFNGRCSTFCLPTKDGYKCGCEDKVSLTDGFNCDNVCSMKIAHGKTKDCTIYPGAVCDYTCDKLYEKNPSYSTIKCLTNTSWSVPEHNLCREKTCQLTIRNGAFTGLCDGKIGNRCTYKCNSNHAAIERIPTVTCYAHTDGQVKWTVDVDTLCERTVSCSSSIPNGQQSCISPTAGSECSVTCNQGFVPFSRSEKIVCMSTGNWSEHVNYICRATTPCALSLENGRFSSSCQGKTFEKCSFACDKGFETAISQENVCLSTGKWSIPTEKLCTVPAVTKTSAQTSSQSVQVVGGVLGTILVILIIIVVIGAVCYFTRRREMRSAIYKNEPNVYFNNPPVDENSYNQFNQPTSTGDRYHQFSNPMTESDNAYDMISEKKTNQPQEKGPATYYLRDVEEKKLDTSFKSPH